ncbi:F-box domain-containing protein [Rutstroemia sp. NJR-2017a BBW]|nr:F-box domain-containing protein [Rutstroemia sp. NJR-2017a BBW]
MTRRLSVVPPPLPSILTSASAPSLSTLPNELKLEIFSYLDPIDGTAFGLTSRHSYLIYRAIFPSPIPLSTRRVGPNSLEAAWAFKGGNGEQKCAHCGVYRCELWKHISTWMGAEREYCSMKGNFGRRGREGTEERGCWRGKPSKPRRCGRHPERTTTVHQDDVGVREEIERVVREASRRLGDSEVVGGREVMMG